MSFDNKRSGETYQIFLDSSSETEDFFILTLQHRLTSPPSSMARASTGPAYPERFYAAASYVGFAGSFDSTIVVSKFNNESSLLLYALYQQATVGPCNIKKPRSWSPVEQSKWKSWKSLGNMASAEAMRLFVKILEEEDPGWYSRADAVSDSVVEVQMNDCEQLQLHHYFDEVKDKC